MLTAIRRTLDVELATNPKLVGVRRRRRAEGRRSRRDAGPAGKIRPRARVRYEPVGRGNHRARGRHGARGPCAGCGDPVPEVRRPGGGAAQRLRHDALAHSQSLRRADRRAHAGRILQVRRSVAQPDERGRVGSRRGLAGRHAVQCGRCCGAAARRDARQRSHDFLRAPRDAGWGVGAAALSRRRLCVAVRQGARCASRRGAHRRVVGRDGRAL